ncbi:MAG: penicillin-binding protein [Bacteroidota bacterium]
MALNIKNEVLIRVYIVLALLVVAAFGIFGKAVYLQVVEGDKWRERGKQEYVVLRDVEAERGNILTEDGSLLATSLPFFDIRFDPTVVSDEEFNANIDSLAYCLATYVDDEWTVGGMKEYLDAQRKANNKYILIKNNVSYSELKRISEFPIFRNGRFRGGLVKERKPIRNKPFGMLASRTIGSARKGVRPYGLEGYFNDIVKGQDGTRPMIRMPKGQYIPLNDLTEIEPKTGDDIVTTIDINLQDVAHTALLDAIKYQDADNGTAIVMEVKTGAIRAIANIGKVNYNDKTQYYEVYNYGVGTAIEPGSTYKLATVMALLEEGVVDLYDTIPMDMGQTQFYEELMEDATAHGLEKGTFKRAFELSSNVGLAKLVQKYYGTGESSVKGADPGNYVKRLKSFNLHLPTGITIEGEEAPYIKDPDNLQDNWSGTTLPWMSIGYELEITPLQLLNLYNTIANDGRMMKPYLVSGIHRYGEPVKKIKPTVMKRQIASEETIRKVKVLLEAVVESGTAKDLKSNRYRFAAKTGTAQINYQKVKQKSELKYRASFAGYFPAEDPVYSCIVVITNPQVGKYGGEVAGPVFRKIADYSFHSKIALQHAVNMEKRPVYTEKKLPGMDIGNRRDMETVMRYLDLPYKEFTNAHWAVARADGDSLTVQKRTIRKEVVPNVVGMGLRDAVYVAENLGLRVQAKGYGKVVRQSIIPGTDIKGQILTLTLR